MKIVSVATMRTLDQTAMDRGTPGDVLMDRAGEGAFGELAVFLERRFRPRHRRRLVVVAGKGNNGGDGHVVARYAAARLGLPVALYSVCERGELQGAARIHAERLPPTVRFAVCSRLPPEALVPGTIVVDALLGTGSSGPPRPPCDELIRQINESGLPIVALDVPSGMDADTGAAAADAVVADLTVTMGLPKAGLVTPAGLARCGALRCVDIGLPADAVAAAPGAGEAVFEADAAALLRRRPRDSHKGTFGHVLVAGGSRQYGGAPVLAAEAALRSGCGLVTVALPGAVAGAWPGLRSLIVRRVPDSASGHFTAASVEAVLALAGQMQAVVFGPGVGRESGTARLLAELLAGTMPLVVDADGLFLLAGLAPWLPRQAPTVLTPHPGEMRHLLQGTGQGHLLGASRVEQACGLARRTGCHVVLKGQGSVIAAPDGRWAVNTSGSSGLASAGSGDVLAGLLAGLLGQGFPPWDALTLGVFVHGYCAEIAASGDRALVADDLLELIGPAFRELSPFA